jgi:hypothetical protein
MTSDRLVTHLRRRLGRDWAVSADSPDAAVAYGPCRLRLWVGSHGWWTIRQSDASDAAQRWPVVASGMARDGWAHALADLLPSTEVAHAV